MNSFSKSKLDRAVNLISKAAKHLEEASREEKDINLASQFAEMAMMLYGKGDVVAGLNHYESPQPKENNSFTVPWEQGDILQVQEPHQKFSHDTYLFKEVKGDEVLLTNIDSEEEVSFNVDYWSRCSVTLIEGGM